MKLFYKSVLTVIFIFSLISAKAELNLQSTTKYCLVSSYKNFTDTTCLEDDRSTTSGNFCYGFNKRVPAKALQEWYFIPVTGSPTQYYIRNAGNRCYISATPVEDSNDYFYVTRSALKSDVNPWTVTELDNGQVVLSCMDDYGVTYYLHASDTTKTPPLFYNVKLCKDSRFAWTVQEAATLDAIQAVHTSGPINISVSGHRIFVSGTKRYRILNLAGINVTNVNELTAGIYFVLADGKITKTIIK